MAVPPPLAAGLGEARTRLLADGLPVPELRGKLLRPVVAWSLVPPDERSSVDAGFWSGALAVQMAHEASLLHDDIVDAAQERRGAPTAVAARGVGPALVQGDHVLTAAYRAAARVGAPAFLELFVEAVERTVAGEAAQGRSRGEVLSDERYDALIRDKSGQLFGAVAALHATLRGREPGPYRALGLALGALYQRVDDLLDVCPGAGLGKSPLQDYRQAKWTWVLGEAGITRFDLPEDDLLRTLFTPDPGAGRPSPLERCLGRLEELSEELLAAHARLVPDDEVLPALLAGWLERARSAVRAGAPDAAPASSTFHPDALDRALATRLDAVGGPGAWPAYFGHHGRTFRFASRLFPSWAAERVAEVYAFCRFTDDLADEAQGAPDAAADDPPRPDSIGLRRALLERWRLHARRAYGGAATGFALVDVAMGRMRDAGAPFDYVDALVDGVASDLGPVRVQTRAELERYTYRVASVVGGWVTTLFGVSDPEVLSRAYRLGHAMQLTNIVRDVGEDWRMDRVYVPREMLDAHGLDEATVDAVAAGSSKPPEAWVDLLEDLMAEAEAAYDDALLAIPALPTWYQRPVAVAAAVYRGIHREIRRNGYDNGTRRAYTSLPRKLVLAGAGLWRLRRLRRRVPGDPSGSGSLAFRRPAGAGADG